MALKFPPLCFRSLLSNKVQVRSTYCHSLRKWLLSIALVCLSSAAFACEGVIDDECEDGLPVQEVGQALMATVSSSLVQLKNDLTRIRGQQNTGSGFLLHRPDWVVTNLHVIDPAVVEPEAFRLTILGAQGQRLAGRILAIDVVNDLALLETALPLKGIPLRLTEHRLLAGHYAYAMGRPSGDGFVVVPGVLVGAWDSDEWTLGGTIQAGMSGGPVLNANGELVGVNRAVYREGPRDSIIIGPNPVRRLLTQALERPYADERAMNEDVVLQLRHAAALMAKQMVQDAVQKETLGPFQVPVTMTDCDGRRFNEFNERFELYTLDCDDQSIQDPDELFPVAGHRLRHLWLRNPQFNRWQTARAANDTLEFFRQDGHTIAVRHRGTWDCRQTRVRNAHAVSLDLHACRRSHLNWPGLYDYRLRAAALVPGPDALVTLLDIEAVDSASATVMTQAWLEAITHQAADTSRRSQP